MAKKEGFKKRKAEGEDDPKILLLAEEDATKILEALSPEELFNIVKKAICKHSDVLEIVRKFADKDLSHRNLFLRNVDSETTKEAVSNVFGRFGEVEDVRFPVDKTTGKHKGFAFVTLKHIDGAVKALKNPSNIIDCSMTICEPAKTSLYSYSNPSSNPNPKSQQTASEQVSKIGDSDSSRRMLFVWGISPDTTKAAINEVFGKSGEIEYTNLPINKSTGKNKGYAFVSYKLVSGAVKALMDLNKIVNGHKTFCKLAANETTQANSATLSSEQRELNNSQLKLLQQRQLLIQQDYNQQQGSVSSVSSVQSNCSKWPLNKTLHLSAFNNPPWVFSALGQSVQQSVINSSYLASSTLGQYSSTNSSALSSVPRNISSNAPYYSSAGVGLGTNLILQGFTSRPDAISGNFGNSFQGRSYGGLGSGGGSLYGSSAASGSSMVSRLL